MNVDDDYEPTMSPLCQSIERDGKSVRVDIYDNGEGGWILDVVDEFGNSVVWDDSFDAYIVINPENDALRKKYAKQEIDFLFSLLPKNEQSVITEDGYELYYR